MVLIAKKAGDLCSPIFEIENLYLVRNTDFFQHPMDNASALHGVMIERNGFRHDSPENFQ